MFVGKHFDRQRSGEMILKNLENVCLFECSYDGKMILTSSEFLHKTCVSNHRVDLEKI